jgi:hypothetical protein
MQTLQNGYRAMGVLWDVNWERMIFPLAIMASLSLGAYLGSLGFFWP